MTLSLCNLRLAIVDDDLDKALAAPFALVELVEFPPSCQRRIVGLEAHCRNAALHKAVPFDLLSVDINFQDDINDPVRPAHSTSSEDEHSVFRVADPTRMTASGLYHGMALLARRQSVDEVKNVMPLAWEVRSAAPQAFARRPDLQNDAVRGYSLLRSMLAKPGDGEPLEECIRREFMAAHPHRELPPATSLLEVFKADLIGQEISSGLVPDVLLKLLPRWRRLLLEAVRLRSVVLDAKALARQQRELRALARLPLPEISTIKPDGHYVPLQGIGGKEVAYGIRLASVLADLVVGAGIDVTLKTPRLSTGELPEASVVEWFDALVEIATRSADFSGKLLAVRRDFVRAIERKSVEELWKKDYQQFPDKRLLLYVLMRTRLWVRATDSDRQDPPDRVDTAAGEPGVSLSSLYGLLDANEQTYRRPLAENRILSMTPRDLRDALRQALVSAQGELVDSPHWSKWLAQGLQQFCTAAAAEGGLGISGAVARQRAPGLF